MGLKKAGYTPKKRNANTRKRKVIIVLSTEGSLVFVSFCIFYEAVFFK